MSRWWQSICLACALVLGLSNAAAQPDGWPRTLSVGEGLMTIYPLQVDGMQDSVVAYRAALAWRPTPDAEPVFGAGWFDSEAEIDRAAGLVRSNALRVHRVRFPEQAEELQDRLAAALAAQSPGWNLVHPLDQFEADLRAAAAEADSTRQLNTDPPKIIYRDRPALLVTLDGDPVMREIEDSPYRAVVNTPYPLIGDGRRYYLNVAKDVWYRADRPTGPYRFESNTPAGIAALVEPGEAARPAGTPAEPVNAANAPEIVVATEPTELIVTEGPAVFVPLVDDLLVLQNSDDDVFMHVASQQYYIVLSGRWYRANSLHGPWAYQAAADLPPAFADIPRSSAQADARVHVAGTEEAQAAALDAQVPQTAAVGRGRADVEADYDGTPEFRPVDGTGLEYAANTGATVLRSGRRYYLVEDGVWYVSDDPGGPWQVSAWRPQEVSRIAPTSPVYHVKYVYIYDSTPEVVYVGYTPGYLGSYVYGGTVVYGTGWYYRPWVSPYCYYPRSATWGFHASYSPWLGWGFGLSWNWGWDPFYAHWWAGGYWHHHHNWYNRHYRYWGPRGYRPRTASYVHRGHVNRNDGHRDDDRQHRDGDWRRRDDPYRGPGRQVGIASLQDRWRSPGSGAPGAGRAIGYADERSRTDPRRDRERRGTGAPGPNDRRTVTVSDLRLKAKVANTRQAAARSLMVPDRDRKVRRKIAPQPLPRLASRPQATADPAPAATPRAPARTARQPLRESQGAAPRPPARYRAAPEQRQSAAPQGRGATRAAATSPGSRRVAPELPPAARHARRDDRQPANGPRQENRRTGNRRTRQ